MLLNIEDRCRDGVRSYERVGLKVAADLGPTCRALGRPAAVYLLAKQPDTAATGGDCGVYGRHCTPVHAAIVWTMSEAAVERAVRRGRKLEATAKDAPYGGLQCWPTRYGPRLLPAAVQRTKAPTRILNRQNLICGLRARPLE